MCAAARGELFERGGAFGVVVDEEPGLVWRGLRDEVQRGAGGGLAVWDFGEAGDEARAEFDQIAEQG